LDFSFGANGSATETTAALRADAETTDKLLSIPSGLRAGALDQLAPNFARMADTSGLSACQRCQRPSDSAL